MISHKKEFGVYHWDTFDDVTLLIDEFDTLLESQGFIAKRWKGRLKLNGANQVDIVDRVGTVVESHKIC